MDLHTGYQIDLFLRWPHGRAERLAKKGDLPHYCLPDGSLRFDRTEIEALVVRGQRVASTVATTELSDHQLVEMHDRPQMATVESRVGDCHHGGSGLGAPKESTAGGSFEMAGARRRYSTTVAGPRKRQEETEDEFEDKDEDFEEEENPDDDLDDDEEEDDDWDEDEEDGDEEDDD